jgi:hypothetical protein
MELMKRVKFGDIPRAMERIQGARDRNIDAKFMRIIYDTIQYFCSELFFDYITEIIHGLRWPKTNVRDTISPNVDSYLVELEELAKTMMLDKALMTMSLYNALLKDVTQARIWRMVIARMSRYLCPLAERRINNDEMPANEFQV